MDYFKLFSIPARYALDVRGLDAAYRTQQAQTHPDKFVSESEAERRVAEQRSALLNDAYNTLKDPVRRAAYMIEQTYGVNAFDERDTKMPAAFLMEQMEVRETLAQLSAGRDADRYEKLDTLLTQVQTQAQAQEALLQTALDTTPQQSTAVEHTRKLRFLQKVASEIEDALA